MKKDVQAKDISDAAFIDAVQEVSRRTAEMWGTTAWANRFDVAAELGFPDKVVLAKARAIIRKGLMDGCT